MKLAVITYGTGPTFGDYVECERMQNMPPESRDPCGQEYPGPMNSPFCDAGVVHVEGNAWAYRWLDHRHDLEALRYAISKRVVLLGCWWNGKPEVRIADDGKRYEAISEYDVAPSSA